MPFDAHKNLAVSVVATAPSPATSGTSLVVSSGHGARFPVAPFNATIWPSGAMPDAANSEIVRVTAISTDTLTIVRAQEDTSARTVVVGDLIAATVTAKTITDLEGIPGFWGPPGWDAAWVQAKIDCQSAVRNVVVLGTSISTGGTTTNYLTDGYVPLLDARFTAAGLPKAGDFWHVAMSAARTAGLGSMATPMPWTLAGSPIFFEGYGYGIMSVYAGAGGGPMTFLSPYACTQIDIFGVGVVNGTFDANMDGGGDVSQSVTNTLMPYKKSFSGLSNAVHSLVLDNQSATNAMDIIGGITWADPTQGILLSRLTYPGGTLGVHYGYTGTGGLPDDRIKLFSGNETAAGNEKSFGPPMQPCLAIIETCVNDCQIGLSGDQYFNHLQRLCLALRAGYENCSILFFITSNPDGVTSDVTSIFTNAPHYGMYTSVVYQIAEEFGCGVYNEHDLWAQHGVALGYQTTTDGHGTDDGHANRAENIGAILGV